MYLSAGQLLLLSFIIHNSHVCYVIIYCVKVPPVSDVTCNQPASYNGAIKANMICAGIYKVQIIRIAS